MKEEARLTLASVRNTSKDLKAGVPGLEDSHSDSTGVLYVAKSHLKETESLGDQLWGKLNANLKILNISVYCKKSMGRLDPKQENSVTFFL